MLFREELRADSALNSKASNHFMTWEQSFLSPVLSPLKQRSLTLTRFIEWVGCFFAFFWEKLKMENVINKKSNAVFYLTYYHPQHVNQVWVVLLSFTVFMENRECLKKQEGYAELCSKRKTQSMSEAMEDLRNKAQGGSAPSKAMSYRDFVYKIMHQHQCS